MKTSKIFVNGQFVPEFININIGIVDISDFDTSTQYQNPVMNVKLKNH
jgi:hypothetical protein